MFVFMFVILGSLFLVASICYSYQRFIYMRHARDRKQIKREMLKIKDTEYNNYLRKESEQFKNMQVWNRNNINRTMEDS